VNIMKYSDDKAFLMMIVAGIVMAAIIAAAIVLIGIKINGQIAP